MTVSVAPVSQPIYFYVFFWGERFRQYFANLLLRSLLAPGNFPRLEKAAGHKFLLCCPESDWAALQTHPAFVTAKRFIALEHVPVALPPPGVHPVDYMAEGHARAATICQQAKAFGSLLHPDMLFADGFVAGLEGYIAEGVQALLVPALRLAQTPLFARLALDPTHDSGEPLVLSPRHAIAAATESLHDEIVECEMHGDRLSMLPNCVWWRNGDRGMLVHSFSWSPLLIDHASIEHHVLENLCGPIPDGDYVARNFPKNARIAFVDDSDRIAFVSWTPDHVGARERRRSLLQNLPVIGTLLRHAVLRRAHRHYTRDFYPYGDHVKESGFKVPLKQHTGDLDASWAQVLSVAEREIKMAVGDLFDPPIASPTWRTRLLDTIAPFLKLYESAQRAEASMRFVLRRLTAAVSGDATAKAWVYDRMRARMKI